MELDRSSIVKHTPPSVPSAFVPLIVTILAFAYHVLLTVLVNYIPDDGFAAGITAYALVAAVLSVLGFVGVVWNRPQLVSCFATFFLVDALVAVVTRLLMVWVLMNAMFTEVWAVCLATASHGFEDVNSMDGNPRHDVVTSSRWQKEHATLGRQQCGWAIHAIQLMMMGVVIGMTFLQASLAMSIRRYGRHMERQKQEEQMQENMSISKRTGFGCA